MSQPSTTTFNVTIRRVKRRETNKKTQKYCHWITIKLITHKYAAIDCTQYYTDLTDSGCYQKTFSRMSALENRKGQEVSVWKPFESICSLLDNLINNEEKRENKKSKFRWID